MKASHNLRFACIPILLLPIIICILSARTAAQQVSYQAMYTDADLNRTVDVHLPVGAIEAAHSVSATGAATYNIPIKTVPGTNGLIPAIALQYNAQNGNGVCGWGWSISAGSGITRTGKNYWNDEQVTALQINNNDAFALDGTRLTPLTGNNGGDNTVYGAEAESYARITSHGSLGSGPQYFSIWMKDGSIWEYGNTADARVMTNNGHEVLVWKVNRVTDLSGNYMTFHYMSSGGEHRIDEIWYTGNLSGITPYNHVKFQYHERTDKNTAYEAGNALQSRYLLTGLKSFASGNQLVHSYTLSYSTDQLYSYLQEVQECGTDNYCFYTTRFKYGDEISGNSEIAHATAPGIFEGPNGGPDILTGDFNGDGYTDVLHFWKHLDQPSNIIYTDSFKVKLKNPLDQSFTTSYVYNLPGDYQVISRVNVPNGYNYHVSDFDGDGTDDVMIAFRKTFSNGTELEKILIFTRLDQPAPVISTYTPTGPYTKLGFQPNCVYPGDFDGDGRMDFITVVSNGVRFKSFITSPGKGYINEPIAFERMYQGAPYDSYLGEMADAATAAVIDFDGNGRHDLFFVTTHTQSLPGSYTFVLTFDRNSNGTWTATKRYEGGYPTQWHTVLFGDFNGDRKTDLLTRTNDNYQWEMAFSDGLQYKPERFTFETDPKIFQQLFGYRPDPHSDDLLLLNDFNGDGKTDILHGKNNTRLGDPPGCTYRMYYSKGRNDWHMMRMNTPETRTPWYFSGDFNGDGKADFIGYAGAATPYQLFTFHGRSPERLLTKISDGFGNITTFRHGLLTDKSNNNYSWSGNTAYPFNTIMTPLWCVQRVSVPDGIGGVRHSTYTYENVRFHKAGKGFSGFSTWSGLDNSTGFKTIQSVSFDPQLFLPKQTVNTTTHNGQGITRSTTDYLYPLLGNKRFKQELAGTLEEDLLAGTWVKTSHIYDSYGNVINAYTNRFNITSTRVLTEYPQPTATPVPCKPFKISTTLQRTGTADITDIKLFRYHANGLMSMRRDYHSLPAEWVTSYTYNATGQVINETINAGPETRTATFAYDPKGRFLIQKTNTLGQQEHMTYDERWGVVTEAMGIDQVRTRFTVDGFGRQLSSILSNYTINSYLEWNRDPDCNGIYQKITHHPGQPTVIEQKDVLGRTVRSMTTNWQLTNGSLTVPLMSQTDTRYDARGNVLSTSQPYYAGETDYLTTTYSYDALNRLQRSCDPLQGCNYHSYNYSNGQLVQTTTMPSGQRATTFTDASGMVVQKTDEGGSIAFTYNARGQQIKATPNGLSNQAVLATYDSYGRQVSLQDPDAGTTTYNYNSLGELTSEQNANGQVHNMEYDILGQLVKRTGPEGTTRYDYYNGSIPGTGNNLRLIVDFNGDSTAYSYDALGRMTGDKQTINGRTAATVYSYDVYDRLARTTYEHIRGSSVIIDNEYALCGRLKTVRYNGTILYETMGVNSKGLLTRSQRNNALLKSENKYNFGYLEQLSTPGIQDYRLRYDYANGNIIYRGDVLAHADESFSYDPLNRLTSATVAYDDRGTRRTAAPVSLTYEGIAVSNGNIISKSDVGTYRYGTKPHAVGYVSNNGNIIPRTAQDIAYTSFLKPTGIEEGSWKQTYRYGHDYGRSMGQLYQAGIPDKQRYYFNNGHELHKDLTTASDKEICYIPGGNGICAIIVRSDDGENIYYPFTDHLGSIQALANRSGNIVYRQSFDAWGRYRDPDSWAPLSPYHAPPADFSWVRGFTGHEHLPQFALVHMNARMYDPVLGRMLSPDNFIQAPGATQSYNRYSYCWNNPMRYTDPSGNIVGAMFFASAFLGELGTNLARGESRPFAKAYNSAQSATSTVGNLGQAQVFQRGNTTITAGIDIFGLGLSANYYYQDGDFSAQAGIGLGVFSGPTANAGISQRLHLGSTDYITLGLGAGTNFNTYSISGRASYTNAGYSLGYGYNYYGGASGNGYGRQYTGTLSIGINDFRLSHENDFLAFGNSGDKWRTAALDMGVGNISLGATINTNGHKEGDPVEAKASPIWGPNQSKRGYSAWKNGQVYNSTLHLQYAAGGRVSRVGYSDKIFQDFFQNGIHQSRLFPPGNQNYYLDYDYLKTGGYIYSGYTNTLFTR